MSERKSIELSEAIVDDLILSDVVYAEVTEPGGMGNAGGIIIYVVQNNELICFETNSFSNRLLYPKVYELFFNHQKGFKSETLSVEKVFFNYHYGGAGNHVFVNQNATPTKGIDFFIFKLEEVDYPIYCSVQGVHNCVAYSIENPIDNN